MKTEQVRGGNKVRTGRSGILEQQDAEENDEEVEDEDEEDKEDLWPIMGDCAASYHRAEGPGGSHADVDIVVPETFRNEWLWRLWLCYVVVGSSGRDGGDGGGDGNNRDDVTMVATIMVAV
jgi:hypothetical protein